MHIAAVSVTNLVKRYKELVALDYFNMNVKQGEILGLLGPNGCGKTTAMNCMLSLLRYDRGEILIFGEEMRPDSYGLKRRIGVVPQEVAVLGNLTVYENIDYFCGLYVEEKNLRRQMVEEAIDFVGLAEYRKFFPKKLSGGLKRRLNIACGIAHRPELIFLDEPTVAVDAQSRNFILEGIKKLREKGSTILYTTHYLEEVEQICDRIVIMDKGRNIAEGSKDELVEMMGVNEKVVVDFVRISEAQLRELSDLPYIAAVSRRDEEYVIEFARGRSPLAQLFHWFEENELSCGRLYTQTPSLNDVFLSLTGKELRD